MNRIDDGPPRNLTPSIDRALAAAHAKGVEFRWHTCASHFYLCAMALLTSSQTPRISPTQTALASIQCSIKQPTSDSY